MSTTIDQRVVEMRFDNRDFEKNVSNTMSTLDKLKAKLKFDGASKGLEDLNVASKKVDMSGLGKSVDAVGLKFDAMYTMADQALRNITNRVQHTAETMIKAFTIDPIKTGFQEYETQINAVQTILANTSSKGTTIDDVNKALDELNRYADMTIYNFTQMTRNIGTFTAAGVDLDTSVSAIQGIANLAAVSGSTSQQASTAMYQLSQALATGKVKLQDWNSVVNAGMGGQVFQDALKRTATVIGGTDVEGLIKQYGSFRDSLTQGEWLTTDVLTETLYQFTMAAEEGTTQWEEYKKSLKEKGYTEEQAIEILKMANTATDAATKVKTFTQLWDVLKEAAQSGWTQTWEIIVGDFEEAKALLTPLSDFLTGVINKISDARNKLLEGALGKSFKHISDAIKNIASPIKDAAEGIKNIADATLDYSKIVDEIIAGKWKNAPTRWEDLTKAGYDWAHAQNLVNERLGDSTRHATTYKEAQEGLVKTQKEAAETEEELANRRADFIASLVGMSEGILRANGYTSAQIEAFRELGELSEKTGLSVQELVKNIDVMDGRWILMNSFKNVGYSIVKIFEALGEAWRNAFPPMSSDTLFDIIAGLHKFTTYLKMSDTTAENLARTLKGVFAIVDLITSVMGIGFKIAMKVFMAFLQALGYAVTDVLSVTAVIGDAVAAFRDWIEKHDILGRAINKLVGMIVGLGMAAIELVRNFMKLPAVEYAIGRVNRAFEVLGELFEGPLQSIKYVLNTLNTIDNVSFSDIIGALVTVKESFQSSFNQWIIDHPKVAAAFDIVKESMLQVKASAIGMFNTWLNNNPQLKASIDNIKNSMDGFGKHTSEMFKTISSGVKETLKSFLMMKSFGFNDIANVFSSIGGIISSAFSKWVDNVPIVQTAISKIKSAFGGFGTVAKEIFNNISGPIKKAVEWLKSLDNITFDDIKNAFFQIRDGIQEAFVNWDGIPDDLFAGFINGLKNGVSKVIDFVVQFAQSILTTVRDILGIHSPSTEMFEIGKNVIDGLVNGIKNGFGKIKDIVGNLSDTIINLISGINWGTIFAGAVSIGMLYLVKQIADALGTLASPFAGLGDLMSGVGEMIVKSIKPIKKVITNFAKVLKSFSKVMNAFAFSIRAKALKDIAIALAILVASLVVITFIDIGKLWNAVGIIGALAIILGILSIATNAMSKAAIDLKGKQINIEGLKTTLISIAAAVLMMALAVKIVGSMNAEEAKQGFKGIAGIALGMIVMMGAIRLMAEGVKMKHVDKLGSMMIKISIAMMLMVGVIKLIYNLKPEEIVKGGLGLIAFIGVIALLTGITKLSAAHDISKLGGTLIKMAISMMLLVGVIKLISGLSAGEIKKGAVGILAFVGIIALLAAITRLSGGGVAKLGGTLIGISIAMLVMTGIVKILGNMSEDQVNKGMNAILKFTGMIGLLLIMIKIIGPEAPKLAGTLLALGVSIGILAAIAVLLGFVDEKHLAKGIIAVGLLTLMMTMMIWATRGANDVKSNLIVMTVAIGLMAAAVAGLSFIDTKRLAGAVGAMTILMGMFTLMTYMSKYATGSMATIIVLTVVIAALAAVLILMSKMDVQSAIPNATALAILLTAVSGALFILSQTSILWQNALIGIGLLAAMAVPMVAFAIILSKMNNIQNAVTNALVLTGLMTTMTILLAVLTVVGNFGPLALAGIIALTLMIVPMYAFLTMVNKMNNIQNAAENVKLLIGLMVIMTAILTVLAIIGPMAMVGVAAMRGLTSVMKGVVLFAAAIGLLTKYVPGLQSAIDTGLPLLEKIAGSIGTMMGNFISGIMTGITAGLPQIGSDLSLFMLNLTPFIVGCKMIDESVLKGIATLSGAIIALSAAELIAGIASFINKGSSFAKMGMDLSLFMINASPFLMGIKSIDPAIAEGAKNLADTILILTGANILEAIGSKLVGESSIGEFGAQLGDLGTNLNTFVTNLGTFDDSKVSSITCATEALKAIASASKEIPNEGGWAGTILGENNLGTFGSYLPALGTQLGAFATNLGTFDEDKASTVECAANAIVAIAKAASEIPNEGGWAAAIFGENSIATFGSYLPDLGAQLGEFATNLGTFDEDTVSSVDCAARAISAMAGAATNIDGQADWAKKLFGDDSLGAFGEDIAAMGGYLQSFVTNLGNFTGQQVSTVRSAVEAINAFAALAGTDLKSAKESIGGFGDKLADFGEDISDMCEGLPDTDTITAAKSAIDEVIKIVNSVASANSEDAATFTKSFSELGTKGINAFIESIAGTAVLEKVKKAGTSVTSNVISGAKLKKVSLDTAFRDMANSCIAVLKHIDMYSGFKGAGKYLVEGFAEGIELNTYIVKKAAEKMANAAITSATSTLDEHSPSRVFMQIGKYVPEGFVIGINSMANAVKASSSGMADTAINGVKGAISKIVDAVDNDIDAQPTIRPVLDLSNIKSGAGAINSMLDVRPSVGVLATAGSISSMMNTNQNGTNSDIISAIDKLRGDLGNIGGNNYNINGITYDDGSNVASAIQTLVRATKMERRI